MVIFMTAVTGHCGILFILPTNVISKIIYVILQSTVSPVKYHTMKQENLTNKGFLNFLIT